MLKRRVIATVLLAVALPVWVLSDDDDAREHSRSRERGSGEHRSEGRGGRSGPGGSATLKPATDPTYTNTCADCHFAYPPELLPGRSWDAILAKLDKHFGESIELDAKQTKAIKDYLDANGADKSTARRAVSIMRSIGDTTPGRITEIPAIKGKHHEISPEVFKRKAIGSFSHCNACHRSAEKGVFNEHDVSIPK